MTRRELFQYCSWLLAFGIFFACEAPSKSRDAAEQVTKAILKNPKAPVRSTPLVLGEEVFDFTALAHTGQRLKLSEFLHKPVFVYFCPQDRLDRCQQIATALRDSWLSLNAELSMAFGVSVEDTFVHRDFSSKHKLPFLLIADTESSVHRALGVKNGAVMGYLIGRDRRVRHVISPLGPQGLVQTLLSAIRTAPAPQASQNRAAAAPAVPQP